MRCLHSRLGEDAAVVLFGGLAMDRPYPGSTMVTTHNAGISGLVKTLAVEIAPHRVNALHPGVVGDSPRWRDVPDHPAVGRTPTKRLVTMADVADATEFLLRNPGVSGHDLALDAGITDPPQTVGDCPDWEDNRILDLPAAAGAFLIVSADADLTSMSPWRGRPIIEPPQFASMVDASRRARRRRR